MTVRSFQIDVDGPVHVADYGGDTSADAPTVLCVHGLGGSHANWRDVAAALTDRYRVLAVDLPGHGRTPRLGRSSAVLANVGVLARVVEELCTAPVRLVGTSMGATIAILHTVTAPSSVSALTLIAPPMPRRWSDVPSRALMGQVALCASPVVARRVLTRRHSRLGADALLERSLALTCADPKRVNAATRAIALELLASRSAGDDVEAAFVEAARSMGKLVTRAATYRTAVQTVPCPTTVIHGTSDKVLKASSVQQIRTMQPTWQVTTLAGVGHAPHLEVPELVADAIMASA